MGSLGKLIWVFAAALAVRACVVEPIRLSDDSMTPVLSDGDVAFVSKLRYGIRVPGAGSMLIEWSKPKKGDLVVVVGAGDPSIDLMRRIYAVPGEEVALEGLAPVQLKPGEYFVMAEKKEGVMDSRHFGPLPRKSIIGKVSYTWLAKNPSSVGTSKVESEKSGWRILQPIL